MRTTIDIDERLLAEAQRLGKFQTKRETVHEALKHYVATRRQQRILRLEGKLHWEGDLDAMREGRFADETFTLRR